MMKLLSIVFIVISFQIAYANPIMPPLWASCTSLGGTGNAIIEDIAICGTKLFSVGAFSNTLGTPPNMLTSAGGYDVFVGCSPNLPDITIANHFRFGGSGDDYAYSVAVDNYECMYVTGFFEATAYFGSFSLTSMGGKDMFVVKLDQSNNVVWAVRAGGIGDDIGMGISIDSSGSCYVTGQFTGQATFGPLVMSSAGGLDLFCAKLNWEGNWLWMNRAGGIGNDDANAIATDNEGNSYITGTFHGSAAFDSIVQNSEGGSDVYVAKINTAGNWQWAIRFGGNEEDSVDDITIRFISLGMYHLYISGLYASQVEYPQHINGRVAFYARIASTGQWLQTDFFTTATEYFETAVSGYQPIKYGYGDLFINDLGGNVPGWETVFYIGGWDYWDPVIWSETAQDIGFITAICAAGWYTYFSGGFTGLVHLAEPHHYGYITKFQMDAPGARNMYIAAWYGTPAGSPVELTSFTAVVSAQNNVVLTWVSQSESEMLGYRLYRNSTEDQASSMLITPVLIPATNTSITQTYTHTDSEVEAGSTYYYWLESAEINSSEYFGPVTATIEVTNTPGNTEISALAGIYPNPFRIGGIANIEASLKAGERGILNIFNLRGQVVKSFVLEEGFQVLVWDGKDSGGKNCGSGVYYCRMSTPSLYQKKKMLLIK